MRYFFILLIVLSYTNLLANDNTSFAPGDFDSSSIRTIKKKNTSTTLSGQKVKKIKHTKESLFKLAKKQENNRKYKKAVKNYKKSCDWDYLDACMELAKIYDEGRSYIIRRNDKTSLMYRKRSCSLGDLKTCLSLARAYQYGRGKIKKNELESIRYFDKACELGDKRSCGKKSKAQKKKEKMQKLQKSCDAKRASSCHRLANRYHYDKDDKNYKKYLKISCDLKYKLSCRDLGEINLENNKNLVKAKEYFKKACLYKDERSCNIITVLTYEKECNSGNAKSCSSLAKIFNNSKRFRRNYEKVVKYFEKACNLKDKESCLTLAEIYHHKMYQKEKEASVFYKKSCDLGNKNSCKLAKIFKIYNDCNLGNAKACDEAGTLKDLGIDVIRNFRDANGYFKKACDLGYKKACDK